MKMKFALALLVLLAVPSISLAQGLGTIVGTVSDPTGAAIAGATITVKEIGTGLSRTTTSNSEGYYTIPSLRPTQYTMTVESSGFRTTQDNVTILADQSLTLNVKLQLGASTETVRVSTNEVQVDTSTHTLTQVLEEQRLVELPLNGRNVATLTLTVPGAVTSPNGGADQGTTKTFPGAVTYSTNGTRQNMVSYQLDGGNYVDEYTNVNQPFPFPDALQEFSVQTANYSAQYGQNAGAVVNVITKSGTNDFHGDAFWFVRNPVFNAQNFFSTPANPDQVKRNQYGGTFGGPIIHNKTFFFVGYQQAAFRNSSPASTVAPGTTDIANFLATGGPGGTPGVIDPASATLIGVNPGCTVSVGTCVGSPTAGQPLASPKFGIAGPIPTGAAPSVTYSQPVDQNFKSGIGKLDQSIGSKDKLQLRYEFDQFDQAAVFNSLFLANYKDGSLITSQNALVHETHSFTNSFLNDFRLSYSRDNASRGPADDALSVRSLGVDIPFQPAGNAIQSISVQNGFSFGDNPTGGFIRNNIALSEDLAWIKGKHDLRFGGGVEWSRVDVRNLFRQPGLFTFCRQDLAIGQAAAQPIFNNFLAGNICDSSPTTTGLLQGAGEFKENRNVFSGIYFQDNYRVTRRLTLNLGIRYEPAFIWDEIKGRVSSFTITGLESNVRSQAFPNFPPGVYFPGDPGINHRGLDPSLNNFAPRVGFAYDVFGDGKTSMRGGFGVFYDSRIVGIMNNRFVDESPFSPQFTLTSNATGAGANQVFPGSFSDPICQAAGTQMRLGCLNQTTTMISCGTSSAVAYPFPFHYPPAPTACPGLALQVNSYDPSGDYKVPTVYTWNLTLERQLPANMLLRFAYVGTRSNHIIETLDLNPGVPTAATKVGQTGQGYLNGIAVNLGLNANTFSPQVEAAVDDVNAIYNALQVSLEKRMTHGLTVLANYTYSKSLDDLPFGAGVTAFDNFSALPFNAVGRHQFDYGPSDFDRTHVFVTSYVWQLPSWKDVNPVVHWVLGDIELSGIFSAESGRPITILQGTNVSGTGIGVDRATFFPGGIDPYSSTACAGNKQCYSWLNKGAFVPLAQITTLTAGNVGKGSLRLPAYVNWDMALAKNFIITERFRLQFRAEYFNILNHPNFGAQDAATSTGNIGNFNAISASTFGTFRAGQAFDPRIAQFALKLFF